MRKTKFLYLLKWETSGYDKAQGFVVSAESERLARIYASAECGNEGAEAWLISASCVKIGIAIQSHQCGVILRDYHNG